MDGLNMTTAADHKHFRKTYLSAEAACCKKVRTCAEQNPLEPPSQEGLSADKWNDIQDIGYLGNINKIQSNDL